MKIQRNGPGLGGRLIVFVGALVLAVASVVLRLAYIQLFPIPHLDRLEKNQYMTVVQIPPTRGKILDRRGEELATSIAAPSLYGDATMIKSPRTLARKLSQLLDVKERDLYLNFKSNKHFFWIKRLMDSDLAAEIKGWDEPGLKFIEETKRVYPNQSLLSQTLGFVGSEGKGLEGIEKQYDSELKGEKQKFLSRRDARGRPLVVTGQLFEFQGEGASLETTVDKDLQYELERELEKVTANQQADGAYGIVMDPLTGEVLAMGSYPTFDPLSGGKAKPELRRNHVTFDLYEPGSTFKVVTIAAGLRSGRIHPNTKFFCENGKFKIGNKTIHEAETTHGFGWLTLAEILEVSSNIGTSKVALSIGQNDFEKMIDDFGFGQKTGIDFPGEGKGLIVSGRWPDHLLANVSFGHGIGVTAIQMANVYSAIANGGKLMTPYIVRSVKDADGKVIELRTPAIRKQVLSSKEASLLTMMLSGVTEQGGTGTLARVDGYPVAGKTGTAQKVNPAGKGYSKNAYIASFIGFVPANNPQFTIYVVVDNPKKQHHGADVAAPIFNHLASFALHQKGFMPIVVSDNGEAPLSPNADPGLEKPDWVKPKGVALISQATADVVPDLSGLTIREVTQLLESQKAQEKTKFEFVGSGVVEQQYPEPGEPWSKKLRVVFRTGE